jgi:hypothetical protein
MFSYHSPAKEQEPGSLVVKVKVSRGLSTDTLKISAPRPMSFGHLYVLSRLEKERKRDKKSGERGVKGGTGGVEIFKMIHKIWADYS